MAKRFTDSKKWRNEWFRTLGDRAKLAWIYLCDECDKAGVMQIDYGLISFQLGFKVTNKTLSDWFGMKIYLFDNDRILVRQFFEFQYGTSKDTWSAKVEARKQLEALGFEIRDGKVFIPSDNDSLSTVETQSGESDHTPLIRVRGRVSNCIKEETKKFDFDLVYKDYPRKEGKQKGFDICRREIKTIGDYELVSDAVKRYKRHISDKKIEPRYIKQFSTFMASWRDWCDPDAGETVAVIRASDYSGIQFTGPEGAA